MKHIAKALPRRNHSQPQTAPPPPASTPASASAAKPACPFCNDLGLVRVDLPVGHPDFGRLQPCSCAVSTRADALLEISGLNTFQQQRRLADIETDGRPGTMRMLEACTRFCKHPRWMLTVWGGAGIGKTRVLQSVVNELVRRGVEAVYVRAPVLLQTMREASNTRQELRSDEARAMFERLEKIEVLAVDDWDHVHGTPWEQKQLNELIAKRYDLAESEMGGTLIAMNSDPAQQPEWIASRLHDNRNVVVHNEDTDIRSELAI